MNISIDTLGIYTRLKDANLDDKVAKELSNIFKDSAESIIRRQNEELATKNDLNETKADIIKWVAGMLVAQAAIVATLVKVL